MGETAHRGHNISTGVGLECSKGPSRMCMVRQDVVAGEYKRLLYGAVDTYSSTTTRMPRGVLMCSRASAPSHGTCFTEPQTTASSRGVMQIAVFKVDCREIQDVQVEALVP